MNLQSCCCKKTGILSVAFEFLAASLQVRLHVAPLQLARCPQPWQILEATRFLAYVLELSVRQSTELMSKLQRRKLLVQLRFRKPQRDLKCHNI